MKVIKYHWFHSNVFDDAIDQRFTQGNSNIKKGSDGIELIKTV
jgi:hypothetical protein